MPHTGSEWGVEFSAICPLQIGGGGEANVPGIYTHACLQAQTSAGQREDARMGKPLPANLMPILVFAVLGTVNALSMPVLSGPQREYLAARMTFMCAAPQVPPPAIFELQRDDDGRVLAAKSSTGSRPVNFSLPVRNNSAGIYRCRVTPRRGPDRGLPFYSNGLPFQVVIPVRGASLLPEPDPPTLYEGQMLTLSCRVQRGSHLTYSWLHDGRQLPDSPLGGNLTISPVTPKHAGNYSCAARNDMTSSHVSHSRDVPVVVRALLSKPHVSFAVTKEGSGYHADVTCHLANGTPPVQFRLFLNDTEVASRTALSRSTSFSVPVRLGERLGNVQCGAENTVQRLVSNAVTLEVVPVGGAVHLQVQYLHDAASTVVAVLLRCTLTRGTFPEFAWFLNDTLLGEKGASHLMTDRNGTLLLVPIMAENSGYYRCEAKDSFEESPWLRSQEHLIHSSASRMVTLEVIAVAFSCFLLLAILGSAGVALALTNRGVSSSSPARYRYINPRPSIFDLLEIPPRPNVSAREEASDRSSPHHTDPNMATAEEQLPV
ncbi:Fc receptor-like protein 5 isoform X2 [Brienomyrus brachyistius]|uniref:Fc receptor-like protein 5 isoform X2 n=1 Tax=Brienomyrus brachyistius TaxID=42636 RepID=UPI0020B3295A|nr:Fc receptor-like protein 5 isoform X2 [Brienomyrus brachyistius]